MNYAGKIRPNDAIIKYYIDSGQFACYFETDYEEYLREKYDISESAVIVSKQGYVAKETAKKSRGERLIDAQREILQSVRDSIDTSGIGAIISGAEEKIGALTETQNKIRVADSGYLHSQINAIVEDMFGELPIAIKKVAQRTYENTGAC